MGNQTSVTMRCKYCGQMVHWYRIANLRQTRLCDHKDVAGKKCKGSRTQTWEHKGEETIPAAHK